MLLLQLYWLFGYIAFFFFATALWSFAFLYISVCLSEQHMPMLPEVHWRTMQSLCMAKKQYKELWFFSLWLHSLRSFVFWPFIQTKSLLWQFEHRTVSKCHLRPIWQILFIKLCKGESVSQQLLGYEELNKYWQPTSLNIN